MLRELSGTLLNTRNLEIIQVHFTPSTVVSLDPVTGLLVAGNNNASVSIENLVGPGVALPGQVLTADSAGVVHPQFIEGDDAVLRVAQDPVTQNLVITSETQTVVDGVTTLYGKPAAAGTDEAGGTLNLQAGLTSGTGLSFVNICVPDTNIVSSADVNSSSEKIMIPSKMKGAVSSSNVLFTTPFPANSRVCLQVFIGVDLVATPPATEIGSSCMQIMIAAVHSNSSTQISFKGDNKASTSSVGSTFIITPELSYDNVAETLLLNINVASSIVGTPMFDVIIYNHSRSTLTFPL
jgi:hypothetical protein